MLFTLSPPFWALFCGGSSLSLILLVSMLSRELRSALEVLFIASTPLVAAMAVDAGFDGWIIIGDSLMRSVFEMGGGEGAVFYD